jgi:hypothetical protein
MHDTRRLCTCVSIYQMKPAPPQMGIRGPQPNFRAEALLELWGACGCTSRKKKSLTVLTSLARLRPEGVERLTPLLVHGGPTFAPSVGSRLDLVINEAKLEVARRSPQHLAFWRDSGLRMYQVRCWFTSSHAAHSSCANAQRSVFERAQMSKPSGLRGSGGSKSSSVTTAANKIPFPLLPLAYGVANSQTKKPHILPFWK